MDLGPCHLAFVVEEQRVKASWGSCQASSALNHHTCCPEASLEVLEAGGKEARFLEEQQRAFLDERKQDFLCLTVLVQLQLNCKVI